MSEEMIDFEDTASHRWAVIAGTRVRVSDIARLYAIKLDETVIEAISRALPHLTRGQIAAAIAYWKEHPQEIESEIREQDTIMAKMPPAW